MTIQNQTIDLSALRIQRSPEPKFRPLPWLILLLFLGAVSWVYFSGGTGNILPRVVKTTRVILVSPKQSATVLSASGYVVARSKAEISPKSLGRVAWLNLEEGQKVKKGELVARLESQDLEAQKKQSAATVEQAKLNLIRFEGLFKKGAGTRQAFDDALATLKVNQAQLEYVEEQIRNTEIYAPIDGVVTVKRAFLGETVAPQGYGGSGSSGATFAVIVDLASLEMEADINEANLARLNTATRAEITLDAYPEVPFEAKLRQIVPTADRQKGTVKVKIAFLKPDPRILPEMSCRVTFLMASLQNEDPKIQVSQASLLKMEGQTGVMLVEGSQARFQSLSIEEIKGGYATVKAGVKGGEEIVAEASSQNWTSVQKISKQEE